MNKERVTEAEYAGEIEDMRNVDIMSVDESELHDIADVKIDRELALAERVSDYVKQIGNPYCYLSHGVVVKISFAGRDTLEDCLARCISLE